MNIHMLDNANLEQRKQPKPTRMREHIRRYGEHLKKNGGTQASIDFINYYALEYRYVCKLRRVK
jgi:hypothetical protein